MKSNGVKNTKFASLMCSGIEKQQKMEKYSGKVSQKCASAHYLSKCT